MHFALFLAFAAIAFAGCGSDEPDEAAPERFDAERAFSDLQAQVEIGPRPSGSEENEELVEFLVGELEDAGAEDVEVQRPYANVVATIPGKQEGTIVVGAHHDTKDIPGFLGRERRRFGCCGRARARARACCRGTAGGPFDLYRPLRRRGGAR